MKTAASNPCGNRVRQCVVALALGALASFHAVSQAQDRPAGEPESDGAHWELTIGPYVHHRQDNPDYRSVFLVGLERHAGEAGDVAIWGGALFSNSYGQPSAYVFYGRQWSDLFGQPRLYLKLTGGIIYGYVGEHKNGLPINFHGFGPAIIPVLGWKLTRRDKFELVVLGTAGLMFAYNREF
jgi:hypothetical protein